MMMHHGANFQKGLFFQISPLKLDSWVTIKWFTFFHRGLKVQQMEAQRLKKLFEAL